MTDINASTIILDSTQDFLIGVFCIFILIAGIINSGKNLKSHDMCAICISALICSMSGLIVSIISSIIHFERIWISVTLGALSIIAGTFAISLAVIGVLKLRKSEIAGQKGILQAVVAIFMGVYIIISFIWQASEGLLKKFIRDIRIPTAFHTKIQNSGYLLFSDLNFRYVIPEGWKRVAPELFGTDATLALLHSYPQISFMIIAEKAASYTHDVNLPAMVEFVKLKLKRVAQFLIIRGEKDYEINGLTGKRFSAEAIISGKRYYYVYWLYVNEDFFYQFIICGDSKDYSRIEKESDRLLNGFKLLHTEEPLLKFEYAGYDLYVSELFGYSLDLRDTTWRRTGREKFFIKGADTGGSLKSCNIKFVVIPAFIPKELPRPDNKAIIYAMLKLLNIDSSSEKLQTISEKKSKDTFTAIYKYGSRSQGSYRIKIIITKNRVFLIAVRSSYPDVGAVKISEAAKQIFGKFTIKRIKINPESLSELHKDILANIYNNIGLYYYQKLRKYAKSISFFEYVNKLFGDNPVYLSNLLSAYLNLGEYEKVLNEIDKLPPQIRISSDFTALKAACFTKTKKYAKAVETYEKIFPEDASRQIYRNNSAFKNYMHLLFEMKKFHKLQRTYNAYISQDHFNLDVSFEYAGILYQAGKYEKAIEILNKMLHKFPENTDILNALIMNYQALGKYEKALKLCNKTVKFQPDNFNLYMMKVSLEMSLGLYREAKHSLENALRLDPKNQRIAAQLKIVSGILGEGDNSIIKQPITPVDLPKQLSSLIKKGIKAKPHKQRAKYGAYYEYCIRGIFFKRVKIAKQLPSNITTTKKNAHVNKNILKYTIRQRIKIVDETGIHGLSTIRYDFNPIYERVFVNKLEVRDKNNHLISKGNPKDYFVVDSKKNSMLTHNKTLNMPVSGLIPGCTIEFVLTKEILHPPANFPFLNYTFSSFLPVKFYAVYFLGNIKNDKQIKNISLLDKSDISPEYAEVDDKSGLLTIFSVPRKSNIQHHSNPQQRFHSFNLYTAGDIKYRITNDIKKLVLSNKGIVWYGRNIPPCRFEPLTPSPEIFLPVLEISDSSLSWKKAGKGYIKKITVKLKEKRKKLRDITLKLVKDISTVHKKINVLAEYVQKRLVYKPIEFGTRALIPNDADVILQHKYGDCKDHALLLYTMLKEAGIPAYLCLVNSLKPVIFELPSLEQFNHMIVFVEESPNKGRFIDCTQKYWPVDTPMPPLPSHSLALILNEKNIKIIKLPDSDLNTIKLNCFRIVDASKQTSVRIKEDITMEGLTAMEMRRLFCSIPKEDYSQYIENLITTITKDSDIVIHGYRIQYLKELSKKLLVHLEYSVSNGVSRIGQVFVIKKPMYWEHYYINVPKIKKRINPFYSRDIDIASHSEIILPPSVSKIEGLNGKSGLPVKISKKNKFGYYSFIFKKDSAQGKYIKRLNIDFQYRNSKNLFIPQEYAGFIKNLSCILKILEADINTK